MTILELLSKMVGPAGGLLKFLERAGQTAPDLKPVADEWIAKLSAAIAQENIINLAKVLPEEIANIASGKIEPRDHPSDSA